MRAALLILAVLPLALPACRTRPEPSLFPSISDYELRLALEEVLGPAEADAIMRKGGVSR